MKKNMMAVFLAGCMTLSLAACGGSGKSGDGPVKIQFMHSMVEQERQDVIKELIAGFQDANPGIEVEQIPVNEDAYETKITALGTSGELPAVMEMGQDFAKTNAKNEFIDFEAVKAVIDGKGADSYFDNVLNVARTEDGQNYIGVPMSGWVQGIFYNREMLEEKGLSEPKTWEDIKNVAQAFHDKDNKKYGIAIPTADSTFTEQSFSQFALSNGANVFDKDGNVVYNSPEMKEAFTYYLELAGLTMPGSNDVTEVKDAFMNGTVPMAIYSTYLLPAAYEAGFMDKLDFTLPANKEAAAFGTVSVLSISADLPEEERSAAEKFVSYMIQDENNIKWLHMSPGGQQPVFKSVAESDAFNSNEIIKSYGHMNEKISSAFDSLQIFGSVDGKNFQDMGDVTRKGVISKAINQVTVNNGNIDDILKQGQSEIEAIVNDN